MYCERHRPASVACSRSAAISAANRASCTAHAWFHGGLLLLGEVAQQQRRPGPGRAARRATSSSASVVDRLGAVIFHGWLVAAVVEQAHHELRGRRPGRRSTPGPRAPSGGRRGIRRRQAGQAPRRRALRAPSAPASSAAAAPGCAGPRRRRRGRRRAGPRPPGPEHSAAAICSSRRQDLAAPASEKTSEATERIAGAGQAQGGVVLHLRVGVLQRLPERAPAWSRPRRPRPAPAPPACGASRAGCRAAAIRSAARRGRPAAPGPSSAASASAKPVRLAFAAPAAPAAVARSSSGAQRRRVAVPGQRLGGPDADVGVRAVERLRQRRRGRRRRPATPGPLAGPPCPRRPAPGPAAPARPACAS